MYPKISEFHVGYVTAWYLATGPPGGPGGPKWRRRRADLDGVGPGSPDLRLGRSAEPRTLIMNEK